MENKDSFFDQTRKTAASGMPNLNAPLISPSKSLLKPRKSQRTFDSEHDNLDDYFENYLDDLFLNEK